MSRNLLKDSSPIRIMKTVMSLFAHPDDELSAFGTLANHARVGDRVVLAWMCEGEMTTAIKGTPEEKKEIRRAHMKKIADLIGAEFRVLDFADAQIFPSQENALRVAELMREIKPSILITWNMFWGTGAGHPDHRYTSVIALDAVTYARFPQSNSPVMPHRDFVSIYLSPARPCDMPTQYIDVSDREEEIRKFVEIYTGMYGWFDALTWKMNECLRNGRLAGCRLAEAFNVVQRASFSVKLLE